MELVGGWMLLILYDNEIDIDTTMEETHAHNDSPQLLIMRNSSVLSSRNNLKGHVYPALQYIDRTRVHSGSNQSPNILLLDMHVHLQCRRQHSVSQRGINQICEIKLESRHGISMCLNQIMHKNGLDRDTHKVIVPTLCI